MPHKKLFKPSSLKKASLLISVTTLGSYLIGLIRDRIIATNFGTTMATDTYQASFLIPDMLFNLFIAGALAAAFLPVFSDYLTKDKKAAFQVANTMLTSATLVITALSIIVLIFNQQIISTIFSEFPLSMQQDIQTMTKLMLPSAILFAISNTLGNILMSYKHFFAYAVSPILYNLGIILGVIFLHDQFGIISAGIGVLIGAIFHALIRIVDALIIEYKFKPELQLKHPGFKKIIKLMIPRSISLIAWQINLYIFAIVAVKIIEGGLAAFHFARNIQSFAVSLFGIAFATAAFPYLSEAISKKDNSSYTKTIQKTIQSILFFSIPAMLGMLILNQEIVAIILSGGIFQENSIKITSLLLFFFAISVPFESITHILSRAFYALHNTITPMFITVIGMAIIASSAIFIAPQHGIEWLAIGFSIGFAIQVILMLIMLRPNLKQFKISQLFSSLNKTILSSVGMLGIIFAIGYLLPNLDLRLAGIVKIILGAISFFIIASILKSPELADLKVLKRKILGSTNKN